MMARLLGLVAPYTWALALIGIGAAFVGGWTVRDAFCDADKARVLEANARETARMQDTANEASTIYEQDRSQTYADATIRQETIRTIYRDREVPADCAVPDDARGVLSEAVSAANSRPAR